MRLAASHGLPLEAAAAQNRAGTGLARFWVPRLRPATDHTHIFLENAQQALAPSRRAAPDRRPARPELLPALSRAGQTRGETTSATRTIAVIGLGRTIGGDFLIQRRRGTAGVAGQLHRHRAAERQPLRAPGRQDQRVRAAQGIQREYRRVNQRGHSCRSISTDRIESWNAQMEAMYALSRAEAIGQPLRSSSRGVY
jgi:two-component system NtrC family sensor kinase